VVSYGLIGARVEALKGRRTSRLDKNGYRVYNEDENQFQNEAVMKKEEKVLDKYLREHSRKHSSQRLSILKIFTESGKHITADDLYRKVRKKYRNIGYVTVYRTLHLFCEAGLGKELRFEDGSKRYEPQLGFEHHDHLICRKCRKFIEVKDDRIEKLQDELCRVYGFDEDYHRFEIYGTCMECRKREAK